MKKLFAFLTLALAMTACVNDDQYDWDTNFADKTDTDTLTITIAYNGTSVTVTGDESGFVTTNGADVVVKSNTNKFLKLALSGSTSDGSLLIYSWKKHGVYLNGVSITNGDGPAINNQCGKSFYVYTADGTTNTLSDGSSTYATILNAAGDTIDQKATLFSEGQIYFQGSGTLNITGNQKNGIASDDYIIYESGTVNVNVATTGSNGLKVNDGFEIKDGTLVINVTAAGARGIKNDARTTISGGTLTITTSGDCEIETTDGVADTTSCACIKSDSLFTMTAGTVSLTSSGDGGKGLNCDQNIQIDGGKLCVNAYGSQNNSNPHGIKTDSLITINGGEVYVTANRKAITTDSYLYINGGKVLAIGLKKNATNSGTQGSNTYTDEEINAGETVNYDGVTYTIPSTFSMSEAKVLVSSPDI